MVLEEGWLTGVTERDLLGFQESASESEVVSMGSNSSSEAKHFHGRI